MTSLWVPFQKSVLVLSQRPPVELVFWEITLLLPALYAQMQKRVATLSVPGVPNAFKTSASAHSARVRPSHRSAAATAPPTTTSASSSCRPVCRREGLTWSSTAAATKVGNGLGHVVIMLNQLAAKKRFNYIYQVTRDAFFIHMWIPIMATYGSSSLPAD